MRCRFSNQGFTLLEIMVTVAIMAIVLVSIFDLHSQTISMNIDAKFYATAPFLAQQKLTELEMAQFEEPSNNAGDFDETYPGFAWQVNVEDIQTEVLTTAGLGFKKIIIQIGFNDNERTYSLETYRYFYDNE
jgi:prepilin-type N-terminal cleavage/methylation domain-containing protein